MRKYIKANWKPFLTIFVIAIAINVCANVTNFYYDSGGYWGYANILAQSMSSGDFTSASEFVVSNPHNGYVLAGIFAIVIKAAELIGSITSSDIYIYIYIYMASVFSAFFGNNVCTCNSERYKIIF